MHRFPILLIMTAPLWAAESVALGPYNNNTACSNSSGTSCAPSGAGTTTAGNAALLCVGVSSGTITPPANGGTWTFAADVPSHTTACYCNPSLTGSFPMSQLAATVANNLGRGAIYIEITPSAGKHFVCGAAGGAADASCTSCAGVTLNLTGDTNDAIVQVSAGGTPSGISATYSGFTIFGSRAVAYKLDTVDGAAPTWSVSGGTPSVIGVALKEVDNTPSPTAAKHRIL